MNEFQRGVLVTGAVLLLAVTLNAPTVQIHRGTVYKSGTLADTIATVVDWRTTLTYCIGTIGVTALVWAALRGLGDKRVGAANQSLNLAVLHARSIELADQAGRGRVKMEIRDDGAALLGFADTGGTLWTWYGVESGDGRLQIYQNESKRS